MIIFWRCRFLPALLAFALSASATTLGLQKCGEAKLTVLFWDIYESSLYTPTGQYHPDIRPLRLEIKYLRQIKADDLIEQTAKEWQAQGLHDSRHGAWLETLGTLWPDVRKHDVLALSITEDGSAAFTFNGEPLGVIEDPDFGSAFAGIWLSPTTTRPELRAALIGEANSR